MRNRINALAALVAGGMCCAAPMGAVPLRLDEMKIGVTTSREFSLSDKQAGFFYGMTGTDAWMDGNAGWNIEARRVFVDYRLTADGAELSRQGAKAEMYPYRLVRDYGNVKEVFYLVDGRKVIFIEISAPEASTIGIELLGDIISAPTADGGGSMSATLVPQNHPGKTVRVAALAQDCEVATDGGVITADAMAGGFIIAYGDSDGSAALVEDARTNRTLWIAERKARMQRLVDSNSLRTNIPDVDLALAWIELTADELVTWQHGGWGIYAGFPWFTDFWGRDMFISMPGAVLCTGQFDVARDILLSFAKYQDTDPSSPTYGRVPNRLNLEGILYNTTDGTPRFVMQVYDYLKYTGDTDFVKSIYGSVKIATDASLELYVDSSGYLTHADADSWMDAKRQSKYACSPRGNRAVDVQALWWEQLVVSAKLAEYMGEKDDAKRWSEAARKLKANFEADFIDGGIIADHLNEDGSRDTQLRPNTMFAYDLVSDEDVKMNDMRTIWSRLVYPWGVSTLDQMDDQFHPWHEQWHRYHKDDAYHNGTVWLWPNGMAMQRMIEYCQGDMAFQLFCNMNFHALHYGAVGSLSECADAWCRPGRDWAKLSGTFLQAWSNAEHIRAWSQCFLGVRPDMLNREITVNPCALPQLVDVETAVNIADGSLGCAYRAFAEGAYYRYSWSGSGDVTLRLDLPRFEAFEVTLQHGGYVEVDASGDSLTATVYGADGAPASAVDAAVSAPKAAYFERCNEFFSGVQFAQPCYRENLKSMSRYFDPPLDYYSVE